jgi:hypothetical protein
MFAKKPAHNEKTQKAINRHKNRTRKALIRKGIVNG